MITAAKETLGERVKILGHFYQRDEVVTYADFVGDSFNLAKAAKAHPEADAFVFCGVHFMAETADILSGADQAVILPNLAAGCSMADMATLAQVERAWADITAAIEAPVPVTYMNSAANIKAFCGRNGASCAPPRTPRRPSSGPLSRDSACSSCRISTWAAIPRTPWASRTRRSCCGTRGRASPEELERARVIVWDGFCSVHKRFTVAQIERARASSPACASSSTQVPGTRCAGCRCRRFHRAHSPRGRSLPAGRRARHRHGDQPR